MTRSNPEEPAPISLDDAARELGALVRRACEGAPQHVVDSQGREAVLVSADAWRTRTESLSGFLAGGGKGPDDDPLDGLID